MIKFSHYSDCAEACPRQSKLGLLILGHAFFIGRNDGIGTEVTICSRRYTGNGFKFYWFKIEPQC